MSMVDQIKSEYLKTCTPQTMLIDALIVMSIFMGTAQVTPLAPTMLP